MRRCFELAKQGEGNVAPNPMVGAILVFNDLIIGEGYHSEFGKEHAEVNCINSVANEHLHLISQSTLYVSLEPCSHFGKTPPCTNSIIEKKIPKVVVGCQDSFSKVDGRGIETLRIAGIEVVYPVLEKEALDLNKRFFTFHTKHRPYIILKWAQTANEMIAQNNYSRLLISHETTNRQVHKWRSEEASILVGTNTALLDNPSLTNRLWPGKNPIRLVIDSNLKIQATSHLLDGSVQTIVFNSLRQEQAGAILYYKLAENKSWVLQITEALYQMNIQSLLVEGGATLLQSFIDENYWDEARVITNTEMEVSDGLKAPRLKNAEKYFSETIEKDLIQYYRRITAG
ncbi:MAG: bifunctional diaminohydroxyphosphoribosylaminopyrimidine deaminase/5-amino-6-(5-phosphoribosylamino)uracil reductase RibD [Chitinophagia bacterium]|nr:bifunctional diaminohydroxyphosphoribosylaminopyrimidine deaminase/5-amino-6-(5-phosphoribosylamino)uracil reductase RibD [Chitinophagia bacterium]